MQIIPLQALPSQEFSVPLDNNRWDFTIQYVNGSIAVTLLLNSVPLITGMHIVGGMRIIPSEYEEAGNFVLVTGNYQVPDYTQFGSSQQLIYFSAAELSLIRVPAPALLTPAFFDPNAALPLRIFPHGYIQAWNYCVENPDNYTTEANDVYVSENGTNTYVDEAAANTYTAEFGTNLYTDEASDPLVTETNPVYVAENGTDYYFTE